MLEAPPAAQVPEETKEPINQEQIRKQTNDYKVIREGEEIDGALPKISEFLPYLSPKLPSPTPQYSQVSPFSPCGANPDRLPRYLREIEMTPLQPGCEISEVKIPDLVAGNNTQDQTAAKEELIKIEMEKPNHNETH